MLKIPALVYVGAAILGWTSAELMVSDKAVGAFLLPYETGLKILFVLAVLLIGWRINRQREDHR